MAARPGLRATERVRLLVPIHWSNTPMHITPPTRHDNAAQQKDRQREPRCPRRANRCNRTPVAGSGREVPQRAGSGGSAFDLAA